MCQEEVFLQEKTGLEGARKQWMLSGSDEEFIAEILFEAEAHPMISSLIIDYVLEPSDTF